MLLSCGSWRRAGQISLSVSPLSLSVLVSKPLRAAREECSLGMVTALWCPQACLFNLDGRVHSLTLGTWEKIADAFHCSDDLVLAVYVKHSCV